MRLSPIKTARLCLRPYEVLDYARFVAGYQGRLPAQSAFDEGIVALELCTPKWFEQLIEDQQEAMEQDRAYVVGAFERESGLHIASLDLQVLQRAPLDWASVGYIVHNQYFRRGYGLEALLAFSQAAFSQLKLHRLEAHIDPLNQASQGLIEKAGYRFEGLRRQFLREGNRWKDQRIYARVASDCPH